MLWLLDLSTWKISSLFPYFGNTYYCFVKQLYTQDVVLQTWLWVTYAATSTIAAAAELAVSLEAVTRDKTSLCLTALLLWTVAQMSHCLDHPADNKASYWIESQFYNLIFLQSSMWQSFIWKCWILTNQTTNKACEMLILKIFSVNKRLLLNYTLKILYN